jgi:hypothetical protein
MPLPISCSGLQALLGERAFSVDRTDYSWEDIIVAARAWGDWLALEEEVYQGLACVQHMRTGGERPSEDEIEAAANEFRSARNLISVRQTRTWLRQRRLTTENWLRYIRRSLLRQKWAALLPDLVTRYPADPTQLSRALRIVGICSGHLSRFAQKLAGRAAVQATLLRETAVATGTGTREEDMQAVLREFKPEAMEPYCLGLSAEACQKSLEKLACLELSCRRFRGQVASARALQGQVAVHHTDWVRIEACSADFRDLDAAQEAIVCVRHDGEDFAAVAVRAGTTPRRARFFLDELDPELVPRFLSARPNDLVGPVTNAGKIRLFHVLNKVMPSVSDPDIAGRAEQILVQSAIDQATRNLVQWHCPWYTGRGNN